MRIKFMNFYLIRCGRRNFSRRSAIRILQFAFALALLLVPALAQRQRPKILPTQQQQFAGRLLLIPNDARPISWKLPRLIARIADHELVYPSRDMLGDATSPLQPERVITWAKEQNLSQFKGAIISLDALLKDASAAQIKERLEFISWLRQHAPNLPIYGFAKQSNDALSQIVFDDLLIDPNTDSAAYVLVARMLNRLHQRPPKVSAFASSDNSLPILQAIASNVAAVGGEIIKNGKADLFFFVHTPNTDAAKLASFAETLAKTIAAGYYVALADISGNAEPLIAALRERKQLDLLQAYAASREPNEALSKALAHCSTRLIAAKVLRPSLEVEQLRRAERAQIELMMTRYLDDWTYIGSVRARVEQHAREQLNADPNQLGTATEAVEAFANAQLKLVAEELFRTQFRYNLHSVMLGNGVRADFQVEMLQLFKARFPLQRIDELELDISVHLPLIVGMSQLPFRK
jgi:Protein of unknown function (DUF4127)